MTWIALVVTTAVVISLVRGGSLRNLTEIRLRAWWLLPLGFGMQSATAFIADDRSWSQTTALGLILGSYLILLLAAWINREATGMWLAGLGVLMNFTVIALNQGMPVMTEAVVLAGGSADFVLDAKHVLLDESSRLVFLADIIPLPRSVISLGDVFLGVGLGAFLEDQLRQPLRLFRHRIEGQGGSAMER